MSRRLNDAQIADAVDALGQWQRVGDGIEADLKFDSFSTAFGFMAAIATHAERLCHHPDWSNVYDQVHIRLTTHDAEGLTGLDFELAGIIEDLAGRFNK